MPTILRDTQPVDGENRDLLLAATAASYRAGRAVHLATRFDPGARRRR